MNLFNRRLIKQAIEKSHFIVSEKDTYTIDTITRIQNFLIKDENRSKEKSIQSLYLQRIFEEILGYPSQLSGLDEYNLIVEPTTDYDSTEPDGALGFFGKKEKAVKAVIELKPAGTDLDKKQTSRKDQKSPVEQGFGYSYKFDGCKWVIVSNFTEIRLYNTQRGIGYYDNFDIFKLNDENEFIKFYFLLSKKNFISKSDNSAVDLLIKETNIQEENITKEFYKKYKNIRIKLYNHIIENNPQIDKYLILEKVQKMIDRVIFICFCEDLGLLPYNIFRNIIKNIESSFDLSDTKIWSQVKGLFHFINQGNSNKDINRFNGGLFTEDPILDNLIIQDEIIKELIQISNYNFESDLNVNILGHIFEQSIADIEEMKADISEKIIEPTKGKRKKEGIYYTPDYITKYIVENAVGGWLDDRKNELGIDKLSKLTNKDLSSIKITKRGKLKVNKNVEENIKFWEKYREILSNIKVLDPACGSGAFLIQAFDFLYKEGQMVNDEIAKLRKGQRQVFDLDKHILTNNIYGVDLNEESVQITKLSLWLKTANKEKELTALDDNIKCGNSLIEDSDIAHSKAFKWEDNFKDIINNGGFDVIIGNPPYINVSLVSKDYKKYYFSKYKTFFKRFDTFGIFIELGINILSNKGKLSFIVPSQILNNISFSKLRDLILNNNWLEEVCYVGDKVFVEANNDVCILLLSKSGIENIKLINALEFLNPKITKVDPSYFQKSNNLISININKDYDNIFDKILLSTSEKLSKNFNIFQGIVTGNNEAYINDEKYFEDLKIEKTILKTVIQGKDFGKWTIKNTNKRIIYLDQNTNINEYPNTLNYLLNFKFSLINSKSSSEKSHDWYTLHRPRIKEQLDTIPKIFIQRTRNPRLKTRLVSAMDEQGIYSMESVIILTSKNKKSDLYHLITLLNSKLFNFLFKTKFLNVAIKAEYLKEIPIPKSDTFLIESGHKIIDLSNSLFNKINSALNFLSSEYNLKKITGKMRNFYKLECNEFNEELKKQNIQLELNKKEEFYNWFLLKKKDMKNLANEILNIEKEIDLRVHELYKLTKHETEIIESDD